jgi:hypothetical protein
MKSLLSWLEIDNTKKEKYRLISLMDVIQKSSTISNETNVMKY